jgi:hypothetical protein
MAAVTRRIGLSLGADICWPLCFEEIVRRLDLEVPVGRDRVRFEVDRVTIEPFDLASPCRYDLVIDRLTHWYHPTREWIKKAVVHDGVYALNNPWAIQSCEKHTTYAAMMRLGMPVPPTWLVPAKDYEWTDDLRYTLKHYARYFDLGEIGRRIGFPVFLKPYDGGAWVQVTRCDDEKALWEAYEKSGKRVMHVQKAVEPWDLFVRGIGVGPQVRLIAYDPKAPLHARYLVGPAPLAAEERSLLEDTTLVINAFFGWDFNSCEALRSAGVFHPIDFANACPDFQVTSLHYHHPWLVLAMVRWALFVAATRRKMRVNQDWEPYLKAARPELSYRERLAACAAIARKHFDAERFQEFCDKHLAHLPAVARDFYATDAAKDAVRRKVANLFPAHEVDSFTDHFWALVQKWREEEGGAR